MDRTLHPVSAADLRERLAALVRGEVDLEGLPELAAGRCSAARNGFVAAQHGSGDRAEAARSLWVAAGTLLAEDHPYWYERSAGLAALAERTEAGLECCLREPRTLLDGPLRDLPHQGGVWVPAEALGPLRALLARHAAALRADLEERGEYTSFAALVEATGYCLERGLGLLELEGVCALDEAPNPRARRAFFDRADGTPPAGWDRAPRPEPEAPPEGEPTEADGDRALALAGEDLEGVVARAKSALRRLAPDHDSDDFSWVDDIDRVVELDEPDEVAAHVAVLGTAYLRLGFPEHGRDLLERALALAPDEAWAKERLREAPEE